MVNADLNFNRRNRNKRKIIRDRKRNGIRLKKRHLGYENESKALTNKQKKREERKKKIFERSGMTEEEVHKLIYGRKEKIRKQRRNYRKRKYIKDTENKMDVEAQE